MTQSNIYDRRKYIKSLLDNGETVDNGRARDIAKQWNSSLPAILNDLTVIRGEQSYYGLKPQYETQNIRAARMGICGKLTEKDWNNALKRTNNCCAICGRNDIDLTIDHIIPISRGGTNTPDNIQPLCKSCNCRKGNSTPDRKSDRWGKRGGRPRKVAE